MPSSPDNNSPLSPSEVNALLGLEDPTTPAPPPLFRPKRAGEPQFVDSMSPYLSPAVHRRTGWPRPSKFPSLSLNQAPYSPVPLLG